MNCLVFDIETVPDVELGRRLYGLEGLEDAAVAKAMFARQRAEGGSEFLPHIQHRVLATRHDLVPTLHAVAAQHVSLRAAGDPG